MRSVSGFKSSSLGGQPPAGQRRLWAWRLWAWGLAFSVAVHGLLLAPWQQQQPLIQARAQAIHFSLLPSNSPPEPPAQVAKPARPSAPQAKPVPPTEAAAPLPNTERADLPAALVAPPAVDWRYLLLQNDAQGQARLTWRPDGAVYALRLERELGGRALPGSRSEGRLSAQGLSPERFTQQGRRREGRPPRDAAATNFHQGERQDQISFSASTERVPMPDGVQDRISWWLQLAALVATAPQQFSPGRELRLMVVGLRGEAMAWVFEVLEPQDLDLPVGRILQTVHLRRAALGPYGGEIELWLDPARHHLPVRLLFKLPDERGWELQLLDEGLPQP